MYLDCFKKLKVLDLSLIIIFVRIIGFFESINPICRGWGGGNKDLPYENLMIFEQRLNAWMLSVNLKNKYYSNKGREKEVMRLISLWVDVEGQGKREW